MAFRFLVGATLGAGIGLLGCGGHATYIGGEDGTAGAPGSGGATSGDDPGNGSGGSSVGEPMGPGVSTYKDPVCPLLPKPLPDFLCDPIQGTGCESGMACYPYLIYAADASGCGQELSGTNCAAEGKIPAGEECGTELGRCAPGTMCVIGNRPGKRCVPMCSLQGQNTCKNGLVCVETDVEGVGVCG